jgi:N-acyl-L-homoserine lactone synthetase
VIIIIDAMNKDRFSDVLDDMYRLRARVFGDRLGWDVQIKDGKEIDQFDLLDPAYVIGLDDEGHVISCVRALQTTGPHMLSDVFHAILDGQPPLRSATVWESTRFCVDTARLKEGRPNAISSATCELMAASLEYARNSGITDIITVIDPIMDRVLKRSDCAPYDYLGKRTPMGKVDALAALLDCTQDRIDRVRAFGGVTGDVFISDDDLRALLDQRKVTNVIPMPPRDITSKDSFQKGLLEYCHHQIASAQSERELEAALALVDALAGKMARHDMAALKNVIQM